MRQVKEMNQNTVLLFSFFAFLLLLFLSPARRKVMEHTKKETVKLFGMRWEF